MTYVIGTISKEEGDLCAFLATFARWRKCCVCGSLTLYANEQARTDDDFECGFCQGIGEALGKRGYSPKPTEED